MPMEYQALHVVFTAYNSNEIMDVWRSVYHLRVATLHIVTKLLQLNKLTIVARDLKGKFDKGIAQNVTALFYHQVRIIPYEDYRSMV